MVRSILVTAVLISAYFPVAESKTYAYDALCTDSYSKQGEAEADLTKESGKAIKCDSVVLSMLDNGHVMFQITDRSSRLTPLGFAGPGLDFDANPNFITLNLQSIYLPHSSNPGKAERLDGIEGYCFFEGGANIRSLTGVSCAAKVEIGTQRLVYHVNVRITSVGREVPGL